MTEKLNVQQAMEMIQKGTGILIDVREPDEFNREHIPQALSLPLSNFESGFKELNIPSEKIILFQCLSGKRSLIACEHVQQACLSENRVASVEGGINAWKEAGLPVTCA